MDIDLLLKIAGIGLIVCVIGQILTKTGRDEQTMLVSLAGVVIVLLMLVGKIAELLDTIRSLFGL